MEYLAALLGAGVALGYFAGSTWMWSLMSDAEGKESIGYFIVKFLEFIALSAFLYNIFNSWITILVAGLHTTSNIVGCHYMLKDKIDLASFLHAIGFTFVFVLAFAAFSALFITKGLV